ncbi:venom dipeptidyl peptidase 4-like [Melitaea cinxia]|uniref:venom dipeptidyl peptidase 4-like n=1 Tax=Melitaea cinxia TaxID=113334 RepID=UPI001E2711B3|nr:venom dipeptidyl peptidase 4-like [Melitaea cinxia]
MASNSTMEMGTSAQVLVARKKSRRVTYGIAFVAMLVTIGIVITLAVVLTGDDSSAEQIISTTQGPTIPTPTLIPPSSTTTTTTTTTTTEAPTSPSPGEINLDDIINGEFSSPIFNGTWTSNGEVLYRNANGDLVLYNVETDSPTVIVANTSQILQQSIQVAALSSDQRYVVLSFNEDSIYRHSFEARYAAIDIITNEVTNIVPPGVQPENAIIQNFVWGPTGTSLAFVYMNNIYYQQNLTSAPLQVSTTGQRGVIYNGVPDWVYEEEVFGSNNALWFSSNGTKMAYATFNDTNVRVMKIPHFGVPGSLDDQYTEHRDIRYPKPGTNNPLVSVSLRDLATNVERIYNPPSDINEPILKTVAFAGNDRIAIMWTNRVQTTLRVVLCDENGNTCTTIFTYTEENGWIDNIPMIFNEQGNAFITILPSTVNGVRYKQIIQVSQASPTNWVSGRRTNTSHTVAEILSWAADNTIWYKANSESDRAEQHIYSLNSDNVLNCFTCNIVRPGGGQCLYNEATISDTRITINCAGPDIPQIYIYNLNGTMVSVWDDNSRVAELTATYSVPTTLRRTVPLGPGLPDADVLLQVPSDYLSRSNVPLLVYVYGGPDTSLVTRQWNVDWGTSLVSRYGIAVARIDGRGSSLRGVDNMFALNRRLGTVEIEDQITVTRFLQQETHWIDRNRTCIWGWSYGGYAASLALARGADVFRCAIAVAPVVDWRFYDTIYTERYMDTPQVNVEGYSNSSLLTEEVVEAYRNKRYFLVHGTEDDNVHYQHAMLISRLLQRRDVYFTQMSYTDENHSLVGVRPHLYHGLEKFLRENMF